MSMNKKNNIKDYLDGEDILTYTKDIEAYSSSFLTEDGLLEYLKEKQEYHSLEDFKEWIKWSLDPKANDYKQWKDFLIRHGYINEKEEIIYKPENK